MEERERGGLGISRERECVIKMNKKVFCLSYSAMHKCLVTNLEYILTNFFFFFFFIVILAIFGVY
jgi:hypothetical protein